MLTTGSCIRWVATTLLVLCIAVDAGADPKTWLEQGPGPTLEGQTEGLLNNPVSGAINAIAPSPSDANVVYVGTVNGGIWRTTNATADNPTWTPLTDRRLPALSINSLAISPVHPNTLFAGTGSTSSLASLGSPGFGVARSTDGGKSWKVLASSTFTGRRINSIVPTALEKGDVVLAATLFDGGGVFRSVDKGESFVQVSGASGTGLPSGGVSSLVAGPPPSARFYAGLPSAFGAGSSAGVYRSDDGGLTWGAVSSGLEGLSGSSRILLAVHASTGEEVIYAAVISGGRLNGVFRSPDQGVTWAAMGVPSQEIFPGGQGTLHGAIAADPTDPNVVFIAGDRQGFPNPNGCSNFSGNIFRGDASQLPSNPWQNVVCNGANGTSPHADARAIAFDLTGDLLHACDGGLYRLVDPNNVANVRQWVSVNGDIRPTELHSVAYDSLSRIVFGGTQDTGTTIQSAPGELTWIELLQGDGGNVAVDTDQTAHPGTTIRYTSFQGFGFFNRTTWDAANTLHSGPTAVQLRIVAGPGTGQTLFTFDSPQFYQPFVLNAIDPSRMLIGTTNIYESMNRGDSLANLGSAGFLIGNGLGASPMAYGGRLNGVPQPDVFYVGAGPTIRHRVTLGGPITTLSTYPGGSALSLVINPQDYRQVFVLDSQSRVWGSFDEGASWVNLTANLPTLSNDVRVLEIFGFSSDRRHAVLIAGGSGGVFKMRRPGAERTWTVLGKKLPHGFVLDLHYDSTDDVLVAGILGRGAWTLPNAFQDGSADPAGIEETDIAFSEDDAVASAAETNATGASRTPSAEVRGFNLRLPVMPPEAFRPR